MNMPLRPSLAFACVGALSTALMMPLALSPAAAAESVAPAIDANAVLAHTKVLASDAFEGRAPGTKGEDVTVAYLTEHLAKAGLAPGNPDGTWTQKVPLVGTTVVGAPSL